MYDYAIRFEEDSAPGLAMFCRDLPELNSYSDDRESAISEALDGIETTLGLAAAGKIRSDFDAGEQLLALIVEVQQAIVRF